MYRGKKGTAEQVALPEMSQLEYELMLANVARKKRSTACEMFQWSDSWSLIQFQLFADMNTITKEAQNTASLDGTKKSNMKFGEHDLWGRVLWMLLTFTQKTPIVRGLHRDERDQSPLAHSTWVTQDAEARCFLKVPGFWLCLLLVALLGLCWVPKGSWGLHLLSRFWQGRGWFLLLPRRQTHGGFRETLLGMGNQPCGCGFRVASQNKPPQDPTQNHPCDSEQK